MGINNVSVILALPYHVMERSGLVAVSAEVTVGCGSASVCSLREVTSRSFDSESVPAWWARHESL